MKKEINFELVKGFKRDKFEEWCLKENKNPKNDISVVEYLAKVLEDKQAKKFMEKYEKGEVSVENLELYFFDNEEDAKKVEEDDEEECYTKEELEESFDAYCRLIKAIADLAGVKGDKTNDFMEDLKKVDDRSKYAFVEGTIGLFGEELGKVVCVSKEWLKIANLFGSLKRGE